VTEWGVGGSVPTWKGDILMIMQQHNNIIDLPLTIKTDLITKQKNCWSHRCQKLDLIFIRGPSIEASFQVLVHLQGSPNQAKWTTFSPWFQWNRPISVKKWSFSCPVSLFKSVFFSPIIILFLQYSRKRSSHVPEIWPIQGLMFNILFQTC